MDDDDDERDKKIKIFNRRRKALSHPQKEKIW